jgi:hypothetical protein
MTGPVARVMHAAVNSAVFFGRSSSAVDAQSTPGPVVVFSNTLPLDFFCAGGGAHAAFRGEAEAQRVTPTTCRWATVRRYDVLDLLATYARDGGDARTPAVDALRQVLSLTSILPNDRSDLLRFLLLYAYGGTYLDIDQVLLRPLPSLSPLLVSERYWSSKRCSGPIKGRAQYCSIIGDAAIPKQCVDPTQTDRDTVLSLFSGVMANFSPKSPLAAAFVAEAGRVVAQRGWEKACPLGWGCVGPLLVTRVVSNECRRRGGSSPAWVVPGGFSAPYLAQRLNWRSHTAYNAETWRASRIVVLDCDFHGKKKASAMTPGIIDRLLWWQPGNGDGAGPVPEFYTMDESAYAAWEAKAATPAVSLDASHAVARLPWEK